MSEACCGASSLALPIRRLMIALNLVTTPLIAADSSGCPGSFLPTSSMTTLTSFRFGMRATDLSWSSQPLRFLSNSRSSFSQASNSRRMDALAFCEKRDLASSTNSLALSKSGLGIW